MELLCNVCLRGKSRVAKMAGAKKSSPKTGPLKCDACGADYKCKYCIKGSMSVIKVATDGPTEIATLQCDGCAREQTQKLAE